MGKIAGELTVKQLQMNHRPQTILAKKMQNIKGKGGIAIAIKGNLEHYVAKVEYLAERIMKMRIKTRIQGKTHIAPNPHAPEMRYAAETRKE